MCLDSALDLWPPGCLIFELRSVASRIGRSELQCAAFPLGVGNLGSDKLVKMASFQQSKRSDNKRYTVEVR